jgi:hypothetical protein
MPCYLSNEDMKGISFGSKSSNLLGVDTFCHLLLSRNVEPKTTYLLCYLLFHVVKWLCRCSVLKWGVLITGFAGW